MARRPAGRGGNPIVVMVCLAITVAMVLLVGWQWADSRTIVPASDAHVVHSGDTDRFALSTPVLSVRRAPGVLSRRLNVTSFQEALKPLLDGINSTSCVAVSVDGQPIAVQNPSLPVIPASNMKLLTAAVAVEVLQPGYTFTTRVMGDIGDQATVGGAGVVVGDLFLVGGGDPLLSTDWWPASTVQQYPPFGVTRLEQLADAVVAKGVVRITGSVVGDGSRYDDELYPPSWEPAVRQVEAGPIDALLVDDGHDSAATPGHVVDDPSIGAATVFTTLLQARGVQIDGFPRAGTSTSQAELASVTSQPLSSILGEMLQTSDNNTAEMLLKEIGLQVRGLGTRESGLAIVQSTLQTWGVPLDGVVLADGSGLSNDDRVTCNALLSVLQHGDVEDPVGQALPVAGQTGTLHDAFLGSSLMGRLYAKTGTLNNTDNTTAGSDPPGVKSLSGYVIVNGGGSIEFALVLNGQTITSAGEFGHIWYDLLQPALESYPTGASQAALGPR